MYIQDFVKGAAATALSLTKGAASGAAVIENEELLKVGRQGLSRL